MRTVGLFFPGTWPFLLKKAPFARERWARENIKFVKVMFTFMLFFLPPLGHYTLHLAVKFKFLPEKAACAGSSEEDVSSEK